MRRYGLKIMAVFFIFAFISGYTSMDILAQTKGKDLSSGRIVQADQVNAFVIIDLGEKDGLKEGSLFEIYRSDVKIGDIKIVKVRERFSAADIESICKDKAIRAGDRVQPSKETPKMLSKIEQPLPPKAVSSKPKNLTVLVEAKGKDLSSGRIVHLDHVNAFVVIDLGEKDGLKEGSFFEIYRKDTKIGDLKIVKVRKEFSSADIKFICKNKAIRIGDRVQPSKKVSGAGMFRQVQEYFKGQPLAPKAISPEPETIAVDINAPKRIILSAAIDVFRRYGCFVTSSDSVKYNLQASKSIEVPLGLGIVSEWGPSIRNRIDYTVELKESPESQRMIINRLIIYLRANYDKEGQFYSHEIEKDSLIYKEAQEMAFTIKNLAEEL